MSLEKPEQTQLNRDSKLFKIFGSQKVKLYEIEHFIFDFGGVMIENTYVIKNLIGIIESDLNVTISRSEDSYYRKIFRKVGAGMISSREFLEKIFEKYYYPYQKIDGALPSKHINVDYYLELWFHLYSNFSRLSSEMKSIVQQLHS